MGIRLKNEEFVNRVVRGTGVIHKLDSLAELETFKDKFEGADSEKDGLQVSIDNKIYTFNSNAMDTNFGWVENKVKLTDPSVVASGYLNKKVKSEQFVFPDEPNKVYSTGEIVVFDGEVFEIENNTSTTLPEAPIAKVETSATTANAYVKGEFAVLDRPELVVNGDFSNGTDGWSVINGSILSEVSGTLKFENNGSYGGVSIDSFSSGVTGVKYLLSFDLIEVSGGNELNTVNLPDGTLFPTSGVGSYTTTFVSDGSTQLGFSIGGNTSGDFKRIDNISIKQVSDTFRCIQSAPIGTDLNNTEYFQDRTNIGVTNQVLIAHKYNKTNKTYNGYHTEILYDEAYATDSVDTIMIKNGFGIEDKGLFSKDDDENIPTAVVHRTLSNSIYHPWLNPNGCYKDSNNKFWDESDFTLEKKSDCFTNIGTVSGRPDERVHNKIYPNQLIDLRISATTTPDNELLARELRNDLSGATEGVEGAYALKGTLEAPYKTLIEYLEDGTIVELPILSQGTQLTTDLIGSPDNYPQSLKDILNRGVAVHLNPLLVGQDGANYIPEGSSKTYSIINSSKILENKASIRTEDGVTYSIDTKTPDMTLNNFLGVAAWHPESRLWLMQYQSKNHILQPYTDGTPLTENLVVYASNTHDLTKGATIANSLTNKVSTGTDATETLTVTKVVDDVITHTAPTQTPDVLFRARLERDTVTGMKKIVYEYDDALINGTQKQQRLLNEY